MFYVYVSIIPSHNRKKIIDKGLFVFLNHLLLCSFKLPSELINQIIINSKQAFSTVVEIVFYYHINTPNVWVIGMLVRNLRNSWKTYI